jgi:hypothetical protein
VASHVRVKTIQVSPNLGQDSEKLGDVSKCPKTHRATSCKNLCNELQEDCVRCLFVSYYLSLGSKRRQPRRPQVPAWEPSFFRQLFRIKTFEFELEQARIINWARSFFGFGSDATENSESGRSVVGLLIIGAKRATKSAEWIQSYHRVCGASGFTHLQKQPQPFPFCGNG